MISSSGPRLTSIHTSGGHARGQKGGRGGGRAQQNNMNGSEIQQQEMNDIQVRVIKDNNDVHIPNNSSEATVEVEAHAPSSSSVSKAALSATQASTTSVSANEGVSTTSAPPAPVVVEAAQVTKALVNDHHMAQPESNGASTHSELKFQKKSIFKITKSTFLTFSKVQKHLFCYFKNSKKSIFAPKKCI